MHQATQLVTGIRTRIVSGICVYVRLCVLPQVTWCLLSLITPLVW